MLTSYGTSCFIQILDDELAPSENQKEEMQKERIAKSEIQKERFMQHLAALQSSVVNDHDYTCKADPSPNQEENFKELNAQQRLIDDLYAHHVHINATRISRLEASTRGSMNRRNGTVSTSYA